MVSIKCFLGLQKLISTNNYHTYIDTISIPDINTSNLDGYNGSLSEIK